MAEIHICTEHLANEVVSSPAQLHSTLAAVYIDIDMESKHLISPAFKYCKNKNLHNIPVKSLCNDDIMNVIKHTDEK